MRRFAEVHADKRGTRYVARTEKWLLEKTWEDYAAPVLLDPRSFGQVWLRRDDERFKAWTAIFWPNASAARQPMRAAAGCSPPNGRRATREMTSASPRVRRRCRFSMRCGWGRWPMKECLIGMAILAIATTLLMIVRADHATPRGAVALKICHGSTIYRLRDGRIVADSGHRVEAQRRCARCGDRPHIDLVGARCAAFRSRVTKRRKDLR